MISPNPSRQRLTRGEKIESALISCSRRQEEEKLLNYSQLFLHSQENSDIIIFKANLTPTSSFTLGERIMNRKLIRPNFSEIKEKMQKESQKKKVHPQSETFAENYYYLKQMNKKTPMAVVFQDGQVLEGYIEWYDKNCIKLNRDDAPNLLVYKSSIKYLYKLNEDKESKETKKSKK